MRTLAFPLALLLVIAAPIALVGLASLAETWGRWLVTIGGVLGIAALAVTGVAAVNLVVAHGCGEADTQRPVLALALEHGPCHRDAAERLAIGLLVGVGLSAVVVRRSARGGGCSARRSVPVRPPQTPSNSRESSAKSRHRCWTGQDPQTRLAGPASASDTG